MEIAPQQEPEQKPPVAIVIGLVVVTIIANLIASTAVAYIALNLLLDFSFNIVSLLGFGVLLWWARSGG